MCEYAYVCMAFLACIYICITMFTNRQVYFVIQFFHFVLHFIVKSNTIWRFQKADIQQLPLIQLPPQDTTHKIYIIYTFTNTPDSNPHISPTKDGAILTFFDWLFHGTDLQWRPYRKRITWSVQQLVCTEHMRKFSSEK